MTKRPDYLQLNRTGVWVPRIEAKQEAISVYTDFSMNMGNVEDMSTLSHIVHSDFDVDETKKYLSDELEERLISKRYLENVLGNLASRLTLKAHVATSMLVAEIDEGTIGGHLIEPFVGKVFLPEFYKIYLKNRREARMGD